jgi:hypothetical protein
MTLLLLLLFASEAFAELFLVKSGSLGFSESWRLIIFVVIGSATALLGRRQRTTPILCLLLASMAAILSGTNRLAFGEEMGKYAAAIFSFEWSALNLFFGFGFTHFSLIFPIETPFLNRHPRSLLFLYLPYFLVLGISEFFWGTEITWAVQFPTMFIGFLFGLTVLIRKYLFSLTPAEKNRLRVVLIGCLAGALPAALALVSSVFGGSGQRRILDLGSFMLPLFPLGLVVAVLKENFSEISKWLQRTLTYALAAAGAITIFFLCCWIAFSIEEKMAGFPFDPLIISAVIAVISAFPLIRWSGSQVSMRFQALEETEAKVEIAAPDFQPIEPNPYIVGNPVRSPELFFGREEDFRYIRSKLIGEQQGCAIVLRGERRAGKTSILFQILNRRLGPDFLPVFIDMQGIIVQNHSEFLSEVALKIREAVRSDLQLEKMNLPEDTEDLARFNRLMDEIMAIIGHRRLVLLVDEYEIIEAKVTDGKVDREIFNYLDSLLIRHPRLSYVFTGSRDLEHSISWNALLSKTVCREISFLARKDAQALIRAPVQNKVCYNPGTVGDLLRLTNGHPFYTQVFCQSLIELLNDIQSNVVRRKEVQETLKRIIENPPPQLFYHWTTFSDAEKVILSALATSLKESNQYLSAERVGKMVRSLPKKFQQSLDLPTMRMHFENLRQKSILDRDQTRYRFTMDLIRHWIQSEHNVWKVLGEIDPAAG